jgi:diadenosine tetraphosphatase ApaH/serine/threonine PP2A family protein phosphatase
MKAIISDIHANWEAFQAVLHDIAMHKVSEIYCLGDLIGYGPDPCRCLDALIHLEFPLLLKGNHDQAALDEPRGFSPVALRALQWTEKQIFGPDNDPDAVQRRRAFLASLPETHREGDAFFAHGSPRDPLNEYIFPEDAYNRTKMAVIFWAVPRYGFFGHTHMPGIFPEAGGFLPAAEAEEYPLGREKVLCNVGSVGQSRDGDQRACYVLVDEKSIRFRRIPYSIEITRKKVQAVRDLDDRWWRSS